MATAKERHAFTLVELLVVIAIIATLLSILMPALAQTRAQARAMVCRSNIRQLCLANDLYASENGEHYVYAAPDIASSNFYRWHGVRKSLNEPFDPTKGPLVKYLGDGRVKECPERVRFVKGQDWNTNFEQGCGGYGYNMMYIGSRNWENRQFPNQTEKQRAAWETTKVTEVRRPTETLMFADTAMSNGASRYIEYSFAEPPFNIYKGQIMIGSYLSPSIHFRHHGTANVVWVDGHVDSRRMSQLDSGNNAYNMRSRQLNLGWFDPVDNSLFDLQ